jgi:hypothetical protein
MAAAAAAPLCVPLCFMASALLCHEFFILIVFIACEKKYKVRLLVVQLF